MNRTRKLFYTSSTSIFYQLVSVLYGIMIPRVFIIAFGSEANGLVSSVSQFLNFISLAECGVGAVVTTAFYKPLSDNDSNEISRIYVASDAFFKKIAYILIAYTAILSITYPLIISSTFGYVYISVLIGIIAVGTFAQYYIGMTSRILLCADQRAYIYFLAQSVVLIINFIMTYVLIRIGAGLHIIKMLTSLLFFLQPLFFLAVVRHNYQIDKTINVEENPISHLILPRM